MKKVNFLFIITPLYLVLIAFMMQSSLLMNPDIACLLNETNRMLAGGKYITDFFETNPPMILYLYVPVCLFNQLTSIDMNFSMLFYVTLLGVFSIGLSQYLLNKIILPKNKLVSYLLFLTLCLVVFYAPYRDFGQREHLMLMLILPYLFSATLELENKKIHPIIATTIGLMAGLGFALKPFFLVTLCLVEFAFIVKKRRLCAWVRIESVMIASLLVAYLISIFIYQPSYIKEMLPLISHYYFGARLQPWDYIFTRPRVHLDLICLALFCIFYKKDQYKTLDTVLILAMIGMVAAFIIPREAWYYHALPAMSLSLLFFACYLGQMISWYRSRHQVSLLIAINISLFIIATLLLQTSLEEYRYKSTALNPSFTYQLKTFFNAQPGPHSISCFTKAGTQDCFPLVFLIKGSYDSRFPFFWWLKGIENAEDEAEIYPSSKLSLSQIRQDKKFLIEAAADDLERNQPKWVIIDYTGAMGLFVFDFVKNNEKFRHAWEYYQYDRTIGQYWIYERESQPHPLDPSQLRIPDPRVHPPTQL